MNRRSLLQLGAASTVAGAISPSLHALAKTIAPANQSFRFALIADTHIIDEYYKPGSENGAEDNDSILKTTDRLVFARDVINAAHPIDGKSVEQVFLVGDCFHNYPSADIDFYYKHRTRIDISRELLDGFHMPVHIGFGNHDYDEHRTPGISREMSHQLFKDKLRTEPYYAVDYKGFRFLHLNNFLGTTWDLDQPAKLRQTGSFGETQLQWAEAQLAARKPTVVFVHYPLWWQQPTEFADFGLHPLLRKYQDNIQIVVAGHYHKWIDFAHTYGPRHIVMASTRYDQNAFMFFDADSRTGKIEWLDADRPEWSTHYAKPYRKA
jgi:hypothetical protein